MASSNADERVPVALVTGFLGSGKTTLIAELLRHPELADSVVIVNELGEVGIDHHLLRRVDERTVLLESGCLCCSLRGDLVETLGSLAVDRQRGTIPPFRRVVVETTGLAEPAPIVHTLLNDAAVRREYRLERVVTTVDAVHGVRDEEECVRQVIAADRIVITKGDIADAGAVRAELRQLNPTADVVEASFGAVEPSRVLAGDARELSYAAAEEHVHRHDGIESVVLSYEGELDWDVFGIWLTMLLAARGADIFRVKGLLDTGGPGPVVLNAVQHVVHPLIHLDEWPGAERGSRLVFIGRNLDEALLRRSLAAFHHAAGR